MMKNGTQRIARDGMTTMMQTDTDPKGTKGEGRTALPPQDHPVPPRDKSKDLLPRTVDVARSRLIVKSAQDRRTEAIDKTEASGRRRVGTHLVDIRIRPHVRNHLLQRKVIGEMHLGDRMGRGKSGREREQEAY